MVHVNRALVITVVLVLGAGIVAAAVLLRQDVGVTNAAQASDVKFVDGGGGVAGYATVSIGSSAASATITLTGVAGAANLQISDLLQIQNTDLTQAYSVTLKRSTTPDAAVTGLTFTVLNGASVIRAYDAAAGASATAFTLPVSSTYDIRIDMAVADGTAAGALTGFDLQFEIVAV